MANIASQINKFDIKNFEDSNGFGNCYKCLSLKDYKQNMYALDKPRCSPLFMNLFGTQYEEQSWLNLADEAGKGICYIGNPEKLAG